MSWLKVSWQFSSLMLVEIEVTMGLHIEAGKQQEDHVEVVLVGDSFTHASKLLTKSSHFVYVCSSISSIFESELTKLTPFLYTNSY